MDTKLLILRGKIKGLSLESQKVRKKINSFRTDDSTKRKEFGEKRDREWNVKKEIGADTRYYLLAYGLIRGTPYKKMEPKTNKFLDVRFLFEIIHRHISWDEKRKWTMEYLENMLGLKEIIPAVSTSGAPTAHSSPPEKRVPILLKKIALVLGGT